jgi:hypothetical protein
MISSSTPTDKSLGGIVDFCVRARRRCRVWLSVCASPATVVRAAVIAWQWGSCFYRRRCCIHRSFKTVSARNRRISEEHRVARTRQQQRQFFWQSSLIRGDDERTPMIRHAHATQAPRFMLSATPSGSGSNVAGFDIAFMADT